MQSILAGWGGTEVVCSPITPGVWSSTPVRGGGFDGSMYDVSRENAMPNGPFSTYFDLFNIKLGHFCLKRTIWMVRMTNECVIITVIGARFSAINCKL